MKITDVIGTIKGATDPGTSLVPFSSQVYHNYSNRRRNVLLYFEVCAAVVISKNLNKGALDTATPIVWVWLGYNHAHIFTDGNMII